MLPPERLSAFALAATLRIPTRVRRLIRAFPRSVNLILVALLAAVLLTSSGPLAGTWAFF